MEATQPDVETLEIFIPGGTVKFDLTTEVRLWGEEDIFLFPYMTVRLLAAEHKRTLLEGDVIYQDKLRGMELLLWPDSWPTCDLEYLEAHYSDDARVKVVESNIVTGTPEKIQVQIYRKDTGDWLVRSYNLTRVNGHVTYRIGLPVYYLPPAA